MDFLDQIVLDLGEFFDALALFAQLIEQSILFDRKPAHPPKTETPANRSRQGHPEREVCFKDWTHCTGGKGFARSEGTSPRLRRARPAARGAGRSGGNGI